MISELSETNDKLEVDLRGAQVERRRLQTQLRQEQADKLMILDEVDELLGVARNLGNLVDKDEGIAVARSSRPKGTRFTAN